MIRDTANKLIEGFYGILPYETARHLAMRRKKSCRPSKALSKNKSSGRTSTSSAPTEKEEIQGRTS